MGREVRKVGMQLPPKVLDELSCRTFDIRHQRVTGLLHTWSENYTRIQPRAELLPASRTVSWRGQSTSFIIDRKSGRSAAW